MKPELQRYLARGWSMFPCEPGDKRPLAALVPNGLKQAARESSVIENWEKRAPDANWAVRTGSASGSLFVLDIDGDEGAHTILDLQLAHEPLPITLAQRTGSGAGWQLFFIANGLGNTARRIGPGIDSRGENGYALIPPSVTKKPYEWVDEAAPIAALPSWVHQLLKPENITPSRLKPFQSAITDRYVRVALEREAADVAGTAEGARNHRLNAAAYALARFDPQLLSDEQIFSVLAPAARSAGLTATESARTILSALRARRRSA